jgi:hypothetical protein
VSPAVTSDASSSAVHSRARNLPAAVPVMLLATTTPSTMSAATAGHGRSRSRTDTMASLPDPDRVRSAPSMRGGLRNPGAARPRVRVTLVSTRAVVAKRTVEDSIRPRSCPWGVTPMPAPRHPQPPLGNVTGRHRPGEVSHGRSGPVHVGVVGDFPQVAVEVSHVPAVSAPVGGLHGLDHRGPGGDELPERPVGVGH